MLREQIGEAGMAGIAGEAGPGGSATQPPVSSGVGQVSSHRRRPSHPHRRHLLTSRGSRGGKPSQVPARAWTHRRRASGAVYETALCLRDPGVGPIVRR